MTLVCLPLKRRGPLIVASVTPTADAKVSASALNVAAALVAICDAWRAAVSARRMLSRTVFKRARVTCTTDSPLDASIAPPRADPIADSEDEALLEVIDEVIAASRM